MATNYYDDNKKLIATSLEQLNIYFNSLDGVSLAQNVPFALPCPVFGLFKVKSNAPLPKFLYVGNTSPSSRVYPSLLNDDTADLSPICRGVNFNNIVQAPELGSPVSVGIFVQAPELGMPMSADANIYILAISGQNDWVVDNTYTSAVNNKGVVSLNISVSNPNYTRASDDDPKDTFVDLTIATVSANGMPVNAITIYATDNPNLPEGSILQIDTSGNIIYSGQPSSEDDTGSIIEIFGINYNINA